MVCDDSWLVTGILRSYVVDGAASMDGIRQALGMFHLRLRIHLDWTESLF